MHDRFPTGQFAEDVRLLQRELNSQGYGPVQVDGWFGPATKAALEDREQDLAQMPAPAKPWWRTKRMQGAVTVLMGLAALFVPALREVDTAYLIELIWSNLDHVEAIITAVGALVTAAGTIWGVFGAATAKAPVDGTLVARVGDRELRLPGGLRVRADPRGSPGGYWGRDRGPFDDT